MKKPILFFLVSMISYQSFFAQNTDDSNTITKSPIDSIMIKKMNDFGIVGMGAAIIIDQKLAWKQGYGFADNQTKSPFSTSTIMNIGSISKTFTGVCLMKAVEEGKVALDQDINAYLPFKINNPNFPHEKITLRQLATHTSSLADRYPFYPDSTYFYDGSKPEPLGDFLKNYFTPQGRHYSKENFLKSKPGSYRDYCNVGAGLVGYILELRTGKKLNEYAKEHIFKPLQMRNSGWSLSEVDLSNHSKQYKKQNNGIQEIPWYENTTYPDGGVRTSVEELSVFFMALLNEGKSNRTNILKKESVQEMLRFQFNATNKPENVALEKLNSGIFWATKMGGTRIGHNGSDHGVRTFMLSDLTKSIGVIVFFNTSLGEQDEGKFFDIYNDLFQYASDLKTKKTNRL